MKKVCFLPIILTLFLQKTNAKNIVDSYFHFQEKRLIRKGFNEINNGLIKDSIHAYFYNKHGKKPLIVLVHGFGASALVQWSKTALVLSDKFNVLVPDLMYHGKSKGNETNYSVYYQAEKLVELIKKYAAEQNIVLIGNSYGGMVCTLAENILGKNVSKLILYDALTTTYGNEDITNAEKHFKVNSLLQILSPKNNDELNKTLEVVYGKNIFIPRWIRKQIILHYFDVYRKWHKLVFEQINHDKNQLQSTDYNADKIYFIWGSKDFLIPESCGRKLMEKHQVNTNRFYFYPKGAHAFNMQNNKLFCKMVEEIINQ